jgi:hypothetical protein
MTVHYFAVCSLQFEAPVTARAKSEAIVDVIEWDLCDSQDLSGGASAPTANCEP